VYKEQQMSRNGSGTYSLPIGNPVVTGTTISSTWANNTLTDIANALTGSLAADGQTTASGNLNMGTNRIINLDDPQNAQDAATKYYVDELIGTLGTMAYQDADDVAITGGNVDSVSIDLRSMTDELYLPVGPTILRTASPVQGLIRFNTDGGGFYEGYTGSTWQKFVTVNQGSYTMQYLVVAGGGGGGTTIVTSLNSGSSGGGGAGGYASTSITVIPATVFNVTVGAGGAGNTNGSNSSLSGVITTNGGGRGGSGLSDGATGVAGAFGGSGGGGGCYGVAAGGNGTTGQGNAGASSSGQTSAGGGGGAGAAGSGTSGGSGSINTITGSSIYYAGGGGGANGGTGGAGGGGNGGAGNGAVNTGGGGGGANNGAGTGGNGGSGVVILSMPTANYSGNTTGIPTVTTSGVNTILTYTSSGTYTA
jgi:hypothetical protein